MRAGGVVLAVVAVRAAVRAGTLVPWPVCAVPECNQRYVQAHHVSYAEDMWLEVVWLCRRCHTELHAEHRRSLQTPASRRRERRIWHRRRKALQSEDTFMANCMIS